MYRSCRIHILVLEDRTLRVQSVCGKKSQDRSLLSGGKILRDRMPRSPGLFRQPTVPSRRAGITRHHKALFLYTSQAYWTRTFESRFSVGARMCTENSRYKILPTVFGFDMSGTWTIYLEEISTHTCGTVHPQTSHPLLANAWRLWAQLVLHATNIMRLRPTFCPYTIWYYAPPWGQWVYRDLVKFPPICIDTQQLACVRLNNIDSHRPLHSLRCSYVDILTSRCCLCPIVHRAANPTTIRESYHNTSYSTAKPPIIATLETSIPLLIPVFVEPPCLTYGKSLPKFHTSHSFRF